jgi:hypothetical protein
MLRSKERKATAEVHAKQRVVYDEHIARQAPIALIVGDSFMERLEWSSQSYPSQFPRNTVLLAKGGDTIEHLLWRLERTPPSPLVARVLLLIGTNNLSSMAGKAGSRQKPQDNIETIVLGVVQCVELLRTSFPHAAIHVLPLAPRKDVELSAIATVNAGVGARLADRPLTTFHYAFWESVVDTAVFRQDQFCDHVHLSPESYKRFHQKLLGLFQH